jgi:hypothetical protein
VGAFRSVNFCDCSCNNNNNNNNNTNNNNNNNNTAQCLSLHPPPPPAYHCVTKAANAPSSAECHKPCSCKRVSFFSLFTSRFRQRSLALAARYDCTTLRPCQGPWRPVSCTAGHCCPHIRQTTCLSDAQQEAHPTGCVIGHRQVAKRSP